MRVYLAGKMDDFHGAWRTIVLGTPERWIILRPGAILNTPEPAPTWPTEKNDWVLGIHDYVGPYRQDFERRESKHEGYFHGSTIRGQHGQPYFLTQADHRHVVALCRDAIERCDLFFAYITSPDCYGTLAEIGLARALNKYVYVVVTEDAYTEASGDYGFIEELADHSPSSWEVLKEQAATASEALRVHSYLQDAINKAVDGLSQQIVDRVEARQKNDGETVERHYGRLLIRTNLPGN